MKNLKEYILQFDEKNFTSKNDTVSHPIFGLVTTRGVVASTNFNFIKEIFELIHSKKLELSICDSFDTFEEMQKMKHFDEYEALSEKNLLFAECIVSGRGIVRYVEDKYLVFGRDRTFMIKMIGACRDAYVSKYSIDNDIKKLDTDLMKLVLDLKIEGEEIYKSVGFSSKNALTNIEALTEKFAENSLVENKDNDEWDVFC